MSISGDPVSVTSRGSADQTLGTSVLGSSGSFCEERVKEVAAHVRKCCPRSAAAGGGAAAVSAGQPALLAAHGTDFSPGRIIIITILITIIIHHHGSSENTGENERCSLRQVQQDAVHGRSLRTTSGEFGSAGSEVHEASACVATWWPVLSWLYCLAAHGFYNIIS